MTGYAAAQFVLSDPRFSSRLDLARSPIRVSSPMTMPGAFLFMDPAGPHPGTLDITRATSGHLAFGHGVHQCLGQQLARIELRIGFSALLSRFPDLRLAVAPAEVPLRAGRGIYGVDALPVTW